MEAVVIELYSVSDTRKFIYNNETDRRSKNQKADFFELVQNKDVNIIESRPESAVYEERNDKDLTHIVMEMVTYTFSGEKSVYGTFTGRNLDFEV